MSLHELTSYFRGFTVCDLKFSPPEYLFVILFSSRGYDAIKTCQSNFFRFLGKYVKIRLKRQVVAIIFSQFSRLKDINNTKIEKETVSV